MPELDLAGKRIIFFVSSMQGGGAERVAALLCNYWNSQGHQVMLVPTYSDRGDCAYTLDASVRLEYLADRVGTVKKNIFTMARRYLAMRGLVREFRPDVVLSFLTNVNITAILITRGMGMRVVVSERVYPPAVSPGLILNVLRRLTYPLADVVVIQTEQGLNWLRRSIPRATGKQIPNPVTYPLSINKPIIAPITLVRDMDHVLLAMGRLELQKGFDILIEAFASLIKKYPGWKLVILGEGEERASLEALRDRLDLAEHVLLPGRVGNPGDWYHRAELYVMSSRFEGFPNTLIEAMAHGLPGVSFDCATGPRDIIRHGVDGLLVPVDAGVVGLAQALNQLIVNKALRQRMKQQAIKVRDRFSLNNVGELWDEALGIR